MSHDSTAPFLVQLTHGAARLPARGSSCAAGYDLYAVESVVIPAGERRILPTGVHMQIPDGYYGRIADRSGLAARSGIHTMAGVIDSDYRGEVRVILLNTSNEPVLMSTGDRIAQLILTPYVSPPIVQVGTLDTTARGTGGFGSTGR